MTSWTFDLPVALRKHLSLNDRAHWRSKATATAAVRTAVVYRVASLQVPKLASCRVDVVWVVTDRRKRDTDNLAPLLKAIFDAIGSDRGISARIVSDDSPEYMTKPAPTIRYTPDQEPRFVVTITDTGGAI